MWCGPWVVSCGESEYGCVVASSDDSAKVGNRWPAMVTCVSCVMRRGYVLCLRRPTSGRCTFGCVWMMCSVSEQDDAVFVLVMHLT